MAKKESFGEMWFKLRRLCWLYIKFCILKFRLNITSKYNLFVINHIVNKGNAIIDELEILFPGEGWKDDKLVI